MYQVPHPQKFYIWDFRDKEYIENFDSEEELINFIAQGYWEISVWDFRTLQTVPTIINSFVDRCACSINESEDRRYFIFDSYGRIVNIHDLKERAYQIFLNRKKLGELNSTAYRHFYYRLNYRKSFKYSSSWRRKMMPMSTPEFRRGPVPYTGKIKGGPWTSSPHTFHILKMYANPEFKSFNRGSVKEVPKWWDDKPRCRQKSWKAQSKKRHQWEK